MKHCECNVPAAFPALHGCINGVVTLRPIDAWDFVLLVRDVIISPFMLIATLIPIYLVAILTVLTVVDELMQRIICCVIVTVQVLVEVCTAAVEVDQIAVTERTGIGRPVGRPLNG